MISFKDCLPNANFAQLLRTPGATSPAEIAGDISRNESERQRLFN